MDQDARLRRLQFRAWHRGTKESDLMVGGYFNRYAAQWTAEQIDWFEAFLEEEDVEIVAWAMGTMPIPDRLRGGMMDAFCKLDFVDPTA